MNIFGKRSDLPFFTQERSRVVSFTHEQNIIFSQTQLDNIAHEQNIICRQLFAGHVVGFRPMKRKKSLHPMIIIVIIYIIIIIQVAFQSEHTLNFTLPYAYKR